MAAVPRELRIDVIYIGWYKCGYRGKGVGIGGRMRGAGWFGARWGWRGNILGIVGGLIFFSEWEEDLGSGNKVDRKEGVCSCVLEDEKIPGGFF